MKSDAVVEARSFAHMADEHARPARAARHLRPARAEFAVRLLTATAGCEASQGDVPTPTVGP